VQRGLRADADVVSVARLLKGPDADLADVLKEIVDGEHVPFLAQYRYKPSGMDKRRQWERPGICSGTRTRRARAWTSRSRRSTPAPTSSRTPTDGWGTDRLMGLLEIMP
jgi:hypothetical protein